MLFNSYVIAILYSAMWHTCKVKYSVWFHVHESIFCTQLKTIFAQRSYLSSWKKQPSNNSNISRVINSNDVQLKQLCSPGFVNIFMKFCHQPTSLAWVKTRSSWRIISQSRLYASSDVKPKELSSFPYKTIKIVIEKGIDTWSRMSKGERVDFIQEGTKNSLKVGGERGGLLGSGDIGLTIGRWG